jgi:hypothetical protein
MFLICEREKDRKGGRKRNFSRSEIESYLNLEEVEY